jgi:hypothetical protein
MIKGSGITLRLSAARDPLPGSFKGIRSVRPKGGFCFIQMPSTGKPGSVFS